MVAFGLGWLFWEAFSTLLQLLVYYGAHIKNAEIWHITWIGSVQVFILFISGLAIGPAFDKWGARRIMIPGTVICFLSCICMSFSTKYHQLLLSQGFLFGIRNAMLYYPATSAISEWFDKRRALALGLATSGGSVGGIFWPIVIDKLLSNFSFATVNRMLALCVLPALIASCLLVKERDVRGRDTHGHELTGGTPSIKKELFDINFLLLNISLFFIYFGMIIPFYYIPLYALDLEVHQPTSGQLLAICYGGSVVGRIAAGALGDRFGRFNVLIAMSTVTSVWIFVWIVWTSCVGQVAFVVAFGFSSGALIPLGAACVAQTTADLGHIGLRIGAMMAFCSAGTLISGPLAGILKNTGANWAAVHSFSAVAVAVGVFFLALARLRWEPRLKAVV